MSEFTNTPTPASAPAVRLCGCAAVRYTMIEKGKVELFC